MAVTFDLWAEKLLTYKYNSLRDKRSQHEGAKGLHSASTSRMENSRSRTALGLLEANSKSLMCGLPAAARYFLFGVISS